MNAVDYINSFLKFGSKPGLERISNLLKLLGNPEKDLKFIHVAGTNGKGSVSTMLSKIAEEAGFSAWAPLDISTIELKKEVRDMCAVNSCGQYGKRWSCPPGCGTLEECAQQVAAYQNGILVQTTGQLEDEFDEDFDDDFFEDEDDDILADEVKEAPKTKEEK